MFTTPPYRDLDRRQLLRVGAVSTTLSMSGWLGRLAQAADVANTKPKRSCILLWMNGGPSTIDLWDLKTGHENGGPYRPVDTTAPGLRISEHLPRLAMHGKHLAILRGMSTKEGDHQRGTYLMRTGQLPGAAGIQYPSIGALVSKELGDPKSELPNFISIAPQRFFAPDAFGPGFLGPVHAPLIVGDNQSFNNQPNGNIDAILKVADLERPKTIDESTAASRLDMLRDMQDDFASTRPGQMPRSHAAAYDRAIRLMQSAGAKVFDLSEEKPEVRDKYGRNLFGQGCLLARRLVERGVPFIEVTLGGWDTHNQNFEQVKNLSGILDNGMGIADGATSRTAACSTPPPSSGWASSAARPRSISNQGRDHFPIAWSTVHCRRRHQRRPSRRQDQQGRHDGGGTVTPTIDMLATVCSVLGIDYEKQNPSNVGRPIRIVDKGAKPVTEVIA